jgi:hypothetical protein
MDQRKIKSETDGVEKFRRSFLLTTLDLREITEGDIGTRSDITKRAPLGDAGVAEY